MTFFGETYDEKLDKVRLMTQRERVLALMQDGHWRTVAEIKQLTGIRMDASVTKRLRELRAKSVGAYLVERKRLGGGTWAYRVGEKGTNVPRRRLTNCPNCGCEVPFLVEEQ
jgi:hypothetical protein